MTASSSEPEVKSWAPPTSSVPLPLDPQGHGRHRRGRERLGWALLGSSLTLLVVLALGVVGDGGSTGASDDVPAAPSAASTVGTNASDAGSTSITSSSQVVTTAGDTSAAAACYQETDPDALVVCFDAGRVAGAIVDADVPAILRFPECQISEAWASGYRNWDDAKFINMMTIAKACFEEKVASGRMAAVDMPFEVTAPSCYNGRNLYLINDRDQLSAAIGTYGECATTGD